MPAIQFSEIAVGDSITHGCGDYVFSDDISQDGRSTGPGYSSILSDLLRSHKNYPHYIANEGVGGDQSSDGVDLIRDTLLTRHPESQWYLIQYGTNDVNGLFPTPSGLGLSQGNPGYPGSFKDNMQQMIEMIRSDGKDAFFAKAPMVRGPDLFSDPYDNPEEAPENLWIKEYNLVVDELWVENGITVTAPDFYNHFKNHLWDEYYDNTHPNGTGYNSMANIWFQMLTQ
jgi:lysophospholipase L1-like esterase